MSRILLDRRGLIAAGGGLLLAGCDRLGRDAPLSDWLGSAEGLTYRVQRALGGDRLAREFTAADISPVFKANGTLRPDTPEYLRLQEGGFADWRLRIEGLVRRPFELSLAQLRRLPQRTQITRHDCVEGWSAIGQWTGVPLGAVLSAAGLLPAARYIVFHCADNLGGEAQKGGDQTRGRYYESIDLADAFHPQTILAHSLNGEPLGVPHGAPLRLRVERQLGYKHAKYLMRIEAVSSFAHYSGGKGGFWEDRGYEWYAGI
jgi:DMSO/TMAO reductase YedYZ molybdopterin-dependent catalytic subunit